MPSTHIDTDENTFSLNCLCGAIQLRATPKNMHASACHCSMCRQWAGSAFMGIDCSDQVTIKNSEHLRVYASSDWAERGFCGQCGTHLFYRFKENNQYHLPAGLFPSDSDFTFNEEIFIDEKPDFYSFANSTNKLTGEEVIAEFLKNS